VRPGRISGWTFIGIGFASFFGLMVLIALSPWGPEPEPDDGGVAAQLTEAVCEETDRLLDLAEDDPVAELGPVSDLRTVLPSNVGPAFEFLSEEEILDAQAIGEERGPLWLAELREDGFRRRMTRAWSRIDGTTAMVQVYEFETSADALAFQRFALEEQSCPYSYDIFQVSDVRHSVGLQIAWADDTESEQVSFVLGPRRYLASVRAGSVPDRALILELTRRLSDTAR
jgi:hypothetical protein